jgi:hypothetical protein
MRRGHVGYLPGEHVVRGWASRRPAAPSRAGGRQDGRRLAVTGAASSSEPISVAAPSLAVRHGLRSAPGIVSVVTVPPDRVTVPPAGNPRS